ncbi:hypothetical protein K466DRAFT_131508 [Polyporus arcularius HHB13444]|uniref:Uncharacterized protein n=1 Tax=Polyporus arcularius HHB13444 TaxID=1314778 RepID=A0A5C3PBI3_9APHY|nr:hypothetical protein K466DRAFT_131508 [Polyporus arcularius HHB13444]
MSSQTSTFTGTFAGIPASIVIDSSSPTSYVSSSFVLSQNVPRAISFTNGVSSFTSRGPLVLPTPGGWYRSNSELPVQYLRSYDVLLGTDWIAACGPRLQGSYLLDPLNTVALPSWCTWERSPLGSPYVPVADASTSTSSASSADDRSSVSSSRGLGSNNVAGSSRGSASVIPSAFGNICPGASVVLARPPLGAFHPNASRTSVLSVALSHGIPVVDDIVTMQRSLLGHLLSGHCEIG